MRTLTVVSILLVCQSLSAQTGPGGIGSATNNVLWLSADNGVYSNTAGTIPALDGNDVGRWADRSGNGNHASHASATERPNFETSVLNGRPVIRFTSVNGDRLLSSVTSGNAASVWAVASWASLPSSNPGIIQAAPTGRPFSGTTSDKVIGMWASNTGLMWGRGVQANGTTVNLPQSMGTTVNTFYSFLNLYNGVSTVTQYVNNAAVGSVAYNGTLASWSEFGIGRQANEGWNGDIAEVIAFNTAVNSAQRIIIDNYLAAKWGLTLTANDLYTMDNGANGNYDFEVAGIGRVDASNIHNDAQGSGILRILNPTDLGNNEFFIWGHDNGDLDATVSAGLPGGVTARFDRVWRVSETGNVGSIDLEFDLTGLPDLASLSICDAALSLRLLVDTNNDGLFSDQTPIAGATNIGGNTYRFANVNGIGDAMRFTLAILNPAVDGPAGVGSSNGATSLKLWFRSDSGVSTTGTSVDSWTNAAGVSALDITESGSQRPTLVPGAVNGFSEISFNGTNRLRTGLTLNASNFVTDEASSFVVNRADNTTQNSSLYLTDPLETNRFSTHVPWAGTVYFDIGNCCGNETRLDVAGLGGLNGYSVWSYDANPASGKQLYRNGSSLLNRALTSTYSSHATHRFNIGGNTGGTAGFEGDLTEVIIFNRKVNSAQRILIENYLAAKYGLALTSNDVYVADNNNYDFDVAGIGRVDATNLHNDARGTGIVRVYNPTNLGDGEFFMWGHDNGSTTTVNTVDVPASAGVQGRLSRVWQVSERNASGTGINVGNLDMVFDLTDQEPITASDLRLLIDHDSDGSFSDAGTIAIGGATALACSHYLFASVPGGVTGLTDGDRFSIGSVNLSQTPLPIELKSFEGQVVDGDAHLKWETFTETDNHFFTIERSLDGKHFNAIGEVSGSGTTKEGKVYGFADVFAPFGVLYYRLKQTDYDGAYSYPGIIRLENSPTGSQLIVVPNPSTAGDVVRLRVKHSEKINLSGLHVRVFDVIGNRIDVSYSPDEEGNLTLHFADRMFSPGVYLVSATSPELERPLVTRFIRR